MISSLYQVELASNLPPYLYAILHLSRDDLYEVYINTPKFLKAEDLVVTILLS